MFGLSLVAGNFNVIDQPGVADVDVSGDLRLTGPLSASVLDGRLTVDRGAIYIRDLAQKRVISLDNPDLYRVVDTAVFTEPVVVSTALSSVPHFSNKPVTAMKPYATKSNRCSSIKALPVA